MSTEPLPIRRLHESLINRIAAGEIIHRPASALKELLENSLDAGSTSIKITVKDGGLKLLQIQDNGCGIRKADLPILAERFTTSKISSFSDLSSLTTYGFRGEALASISYVSQMSIVTKTKKDNCAYKACYADGKLVPIQQGQTEEPKPTAGTDGTTITIENLFYNTPTRLSALRNPADEYAKILDVITKYAVHNPSVSFMCKKSGSSPSLSTPSSTSTVQVIRTLYGHSIAKELLEVKVRGKEKGEDKDDDESMLDEDDWEATINFTSANYQAKKMVFLLFINHRLVESSRLKRALEAAYTAVLPKGTSPFVYLSLLLPPNTVDVNVHPTKSAVHFLNEDAIIEKIADRVQTLLAQKSSKSRDFNVGKQMRLSEQRSEPTPSSSKKRKSKDRTSEDEYEDDLEDDDDKVPENDEQPIASSSSTPAVKKPTYSHHKVRTSLKDRTLDSMFAIPNPSQVGSPGFSQAPRENGKGKAREDAIDVDDPPPSVSTPSTQFRIKDIKESMCSLSSIQNLRNAIKKRRHKSVTQVLEQHTFVGIVDLAKSLSLIQFSTKLYLVNHATFGEELFYQLGLRQFGDMPKIKLEPPPPLRKLIQIAVDTEKIPHGTVKLTKPEIVKRITEILLSKREMLSEYFSLHISSSGEVESIPMLLSGYTPNLEKLPCFLMRLGPQVDWTRETECFESFFRELAYFYVPGRLGAIEKGLDKEDVAIDVEQQQELQAEVWQIQHVLFPAFRRYLIAPKTLLDGAGILQVANLPDLYKVFERC